MDYKLFIGLIFREAGYHLIDLMYLKPFFFNKVGDSLAECERSLLFVEILFSLKLLPIKAVRLTIILYIYLELSKTLNGVFKFIAYNANPKRISTSLLSGVV